MVRDVQGEPSLQRLASGSVRRASGRRIAIGRAARIVLLVGAPALLVGVLTWPMLFTSAGFNEDWINHLWYMWNQSQALRANLHPSYFLNYSHSVFYPEYAFYGGTLYAVSGTLSLLMGDAPIEAYILTYLLGFAASYGGWYWMGRMAGLGRWWAHVPGVIFITSAYYLTLIYARGDLAEFTGVSTIPLLIAAGISILRADRLRPLPALALVASSLLFFGSHSLTVVWGSTLIALTAAALIVCVPGARKLLTGRGVMRLAVLVVPALLVNAWFLLPAIAYQSHTQISSRYSYWRLLLSADASLTSARHLFTLSRASVAPGADFALSLPILAMAWLLISLLIFLPKGLRGSWSRTLLIGASLTVLATVVMTHTSLILALPRPYAILQFTYRLESYVTLCVCGTVLAALVLARSGTRRTRIWAWTLTPILVVATIGAIQQTVAYPHGTARTVQPRSKPGPREEGLNDYTDADLTTLVGAHRRPPEVIFPAASVHDDRASQVVHIRPGQAVYTNIGAGPELVHVSGAKIVGGNPEGNDVLEIGPSVARPHAAHGSRWTEVITVSTASGWPIVVGRLVSLGALLFLIGELLVLSVRSVRLRRREQSARGT
jgi:hypothetical protein